jgi:hypothetical protein
MNAYRGCHSEERMRREPALSKVEGNLLFAGVGRKWFLASLEVTEQNDKAKG